MLYRNGRAKWLKGGIWLKNHPEFKGLGNAPTQAMKDADPKLDLTMWDSQFSSNKKGKTDIGWSAESLEMYKETVAAIKKYHAEHGADLRQFEEDFLPKLKDKEGVTDPIAKKRKVDPVQEVVDICDFSDDEDYFAAAAGTQTGV